MEQQQHQSELIPAPAGARSPAAVSQQEWIESVVGRDWEIFWKPEEEEEEKSHPEQDQPQPAFNEIPAAIGSATAPSAIEQDTDLVMIDESDQGVTQPNEETEQEMNTEASMPDDDEEHEEDWYAAHIVAVAVSKQQQDQEDSTGNSTLISPSIFQVRFVGEDDTTHDMLLTPDIVRPCARAWIRRTRALLLMQLPNDDGPSSNGSTDAHQWATSLPHDTSTVRDREQIAMIRQAVDRQDFPVIPNSDDNSNSNEDELATAYAPQSSQPPALEALIPSKEELESVRQLVVWIRSQVFLRSRLAPVVVEDGAGGATAESDDEPTEKYLDYLVTCLKELEEGCQWYYRCWQLHYRILYGSHLQSDSSRSSSVSRELIAPDFLLKDCLEGARSTFIMLISMDISVAGSKRKRRRPQQQIPASPSGSRRTKRQRKFTEFWHEADGAGNGGSPSTSGGGGRTFNEDVDEEDFRSTHIVKRLVEGMRTSDPRWYSQYFGKMLQSLSCNFVAPFDRWKHRAEYYLGDRSTLDVEASDGETSGEESDDDESGSAAVGETKSKEGSSRYVTFEEIESSVSASQHDRVLQHFDLESTVIRLQHKLESIADFEARAWGLIGVVLDDSGESFDKKKDETTKGLDVLLQETVSGNSAVANVEPFGLGSSPLTRKVLQNAIVYRTWFLDLRYAESVRERGAFVDDVVSRVSKLPPLPSKEGSSGDSGTDISVKLDSVAERVRNLSAKHINHVALFNRYKALLNDRVVSNGSRKGLLATEGVADALLELRKTSVISVAEEMLTSRLDVLLWEADARETLGKTRPRFDEIASLKTSLDAVLDGRSVTRSELVHSLVSNAGADTEVREFARSDTEALCNSLCKRTTTIYVAASMWKERADAILTALRVFGNSEAGAALTSQKTPSMVDLNRVEDLLGDYDSLEVDLNDYYYRLTKVSEAARKWASTVTDYLLTDSTTFEDCLSLVEGTGQARPRGVIIEPTRQAIEMLHSLFQWYTSVKALVCTPKMHGSDPSDVHALLIEGLEVLTLFSNARRSSGEFIVEPGFAHELLANKQNSRKSARTMSCAKLESNPLCNAILSRMVDSSRDAKEGYPLLSLLYFLWQVFVEDFTRRPVASSLRRKFTLESAKQLQSLSPRLETTGDGERGHNSNILWQTNPEVERFKQLIESGSHAEDDARQLLSVSKGLLREAKYQREIVRLHLTRLKDIYTDFKGRVGGGNGLALDDSLEPQLDHYIKLFGWLVSDCVLFWCPD
jgi:hypothetical protein